MTDLPRGTVTFLFTDIEGSTQLLRANRERFAEILEEHQALLRACFEMAGGREIDTQGDAFFVAFSRAKDAVNAAVRAQASLDEHEWPGPADVRVRMGIHTAEPTVAPERYVGLGVHRAARICALGHGGQILISHTTHDLLEDEEMPGHAFTDLGQHRLKDFDRPEQIFQVGTEEFPPLKSFDQQGAVPFAGRAGDLAQAAGHASAGRGSYRRRVFLGGALAGVVSAAVAVPLFAMGQGEPEGKQSPSAHVAAVPPNSIGVIDPESNAVVNVVRLRTRPVALTYGADSIWAANVESNTVTRINAETQQVEAEIGVGAPPTGIAFGSDAVWVASGTEGTLTRIDPSGNEVGAPIRFRQPIPASSSTGNRLLGSPLGGGSVWATIAASNGRVWVADRQHFRLIAFDSRSQERIGAIADVDPLALVVDGEHLWMIDYANAKILDADAARGEVLAAVPFDIDNTPKALAVGFARVWLADTDKDQLLILSLPATAIGRSITVGDGPAAVAVDERAVWVAHWIGHAIAKVDPHQNKVVATINVGGNVGAIVVGGGYIWAAVS
jgi:YVTN family beta-propeller protein